MNLKIGRKTARDKGIPRDKIRFCLVKAGNSRDLAKKALGKVEGPASGALVKAQADLKKAKADLAKNKDKTKTVGLKKAVSDAENQVKGLSICKTGLEGMMDFLDKYQELNERVIGKSASYARPGDRLEVILQPRNPY